MEVKVNEKNDKKSDRIIIDVCITLKYLRLWQRGGAENAGNGGFGTG